MTHEEGFAEAIFD